MKTSKRFIQKLSKRTDCLLEIGCDEYLKSIFAKGLYNRKLKDSRQDRYLFTLVRLEEG